MDMYRLGLRLMSTNRLSSDITVEFMLLYNSGSEVRRPIDESGL